MEEKRRGERIFMEKPVSKRPLGSRRRKWVDSIKGSQGNWLGGTRLDLAVL